MRAGNRFRSTSPRLSAASAGGMTAEAAPSVTWAAVTKKKLGNKTIARHPSATSSPEAATNARLARKESTTNPAGIWQRAAAKELAAMAIPICPAGQCWPPFKYTERNGPTPSRTSAIRKLRPSKPNKLVLDGEGRAGFASERCILRCPTNYEAGRSSGAVEVNRGRSVDGQGGRFEADAKRVGGSIAPHLHTAAGLE